MSFCVKLTAGTERAANPPARASMLYAAAYRESL